LPGMTSADCFTAAVDDGGVLLVQDDSQFPYAASRVGDASVAQVQAEQVAVLGCRQCREVVVDAASGIGGRSTSPDAGSTPPATHRLSRDTRCSRDGAIIHPASDVSLDGVEFLG